MSVENKNIQSQLSLTKYFEVAINILQNIF